jgi:hypothetical protein
MIIKRIVFGEPKPGEAAFAALLEKLDESISYCNRSGPLQHDRVTDVPFTVPALGLNFKHPTPLAFVSAAPPSNDDWGLFAWHHIELYQQGVRAIYRVDPLHAECVRLCQAIYAKPGTAPEVWDEKLETAGVVWGVKFDGVRAYVVFRGSDSLMDWLRDLTGLDPEVLAARITQHEKFGPMWDGFVVGMADTWTALKPLLAQSTEVVFTGHSLGAARAGVAAAFALNSAVSPA